MFLSYLKMKKSHEINGFNNRYGEKGNIFKELWNRKETRKLDGKNINRLESNIEEIYVHRLDGKRIEKEESCNIQLTIWACQLWNNSDIKISIKNEEILDRN